MTFVPGLPNKNAPVLSPSVIIGNVPSVLLAVVMVIVFTLVSGVTKVLLRKLIELKFGNIVLTTVTTDNWELPSLLSIVCPCP